MLRKIIALLSVVVAVLLSGCKSEPPKCSDGQTLSLVRQIIFDLIDKEWKITKEPALKGEAFDEEDLEAVIAIQNPVSNGYDERIKRYACNATIVYASKFNLFSSDDIEKQLPIAYYSQLNDDDEHLVVIDGMPRNSLWDIGVSLYKMKKTQIENR